VFDGLARFEPSDLPTLTGTVTAAEPADLDAHAFGSGSLRNGEVLCRVPQRRTRART
jgi:hypothetical protein